MNNLNKMSKNQVILTTSFIYSELHNLKYCVGTSYDKPPYTFDLKGEWQKKKLLTQMLMT